MLKTLCKPVLLAALALSVLGLAACGESKEEKATKQVCNAVKEINTQIAKLASLPVTSLPTEAKGSVEAINRSLKEIGSAVPNLEEARRLEAQAATKSFETALATFTAGVASATKSTSLEAALKSAEGQIKSAISRLGDEYKKVYEQLKCSS